MQSQSSEHAGVGATQPPRAPIGTDGATSRIDPALLDLLSCPECGVGLTAAPGGIDCPGCGGSYALDHGIPILLPSSFDAEHLHEEQELAHMMTEKEHLPAMRFNLEQWERSKLEFWAMVQAGVTGTDKRFVNIGCGYDSHFSALESQGHTFVNFDMVLEMLRSLQSQAGARFCVNGDLNRLPFKRGAFDYVVSIDVIHHECDQLERLLGSFRDLLRPGGTLFLEDPNAWGMFQMAKSILLPRPVYRYLRSTYHRLRHSEHRPADYEFPTNLWAIKAILDRLGFRQIQVYPHTAYPTVGRGSHRLYQWLSRSEYVRTYHNYHYMLSAVRPFDS